MLREMRRGRQALSYEDAEAVLQNGSHGVLAVSGDDGYPYAVPLSYVYREGRIYMHCATRGHKLDAIRRDCKVSFCVVAQDKVVPERFLTLYRSAVAFGKARIVTDDEVKRQAITWLAARYSPGFSESAAQEIEREWNAFCVVEIKVEHLSGKVARELIAG